MRRDGASGPKRSLCPRHIVPAPQPRAIETVRRRRPMTPRQRRRRHCRRESEGTAVSGDVPLRSRRTTLRVAAQLDGRAPPRATVRLRRRALRLLHRAPRRSTVRRDCCQRRPHDRPRRRPCNPAPPRPRRVHWVAKTATCGTRVSAETSPQAPRHKERRVTRGRRERVSRLQASGRGARREIRSDGCVPAPSAPPRPAPRSNERRGRQILRQRHRC